MNSKGNDYDQKALYLNVILYDSHNEGSIQGEKSMLSMLHELHLALADFLL